MRDFKGMKRQRNRGRGGGGGGGKPQHNANRAFDSNGPDGVKVRGAAQHIYEKYQQLARDAGSAGDRVLAENYLQHAEHYFRVLRAMQPQRPVAEIVGRDQFASGYDIDFEDEGQGAEEGAETEAEANGDGRPRDERPWQQGERGQGEFRQRDDGRRDDRRRDERDFRPRDDRQQGGELRQRDDRYQGDRRDRFDDRPRDDRPRDDRPRDDRQQGGDFRQRDDRPRDDRQRDRFQGDRRPDRDLRGDRGERSDPLGVIEPQATPLPTASAAPPPVYEEAEGGVLRGEDGTMSHAPAFLQSRPEPRVDDESGEGRRPARRRRPPRNFDADEAAPAEVDEG